MNKRGHTLLPFIMKSKTERRDVYMDESPNRVYQLPTEITAEMKMKGIMPITLLIALVVMFFLAQRFEGFVYKPFTNVWYVYNLIVGFILCIKTNKNGEKRIVQSIMLYLVRDKQVYKPIENPESYYEMEVSEKDETSDEEYNS